MENSGETTIKKTLKVSSSKKRSALEKWARKKVPFLFDINSLFYFVLILFLTGFAWTAYTFFFNGGAALYGWDYSSQYVSMAYNFWDVWHKFFKTGIFELYSTGTYLGTDNIGSNSYYGLFDPFLVVSFIFPRAWQPQMFVIMSIVKGVCGGMALRAYLKYLGIGERSARVGAVAYAFCGYLNFMVGFPSFLSVGCTVPLIMLGIEKVIKEEKPAILALSIFLLGIISFFFLVVLCVWGVVYAIWRYFWTIKERSWQSSLRVIGLGVGGFAAGIMMSAWTLIPSLRESALSGRTTSGGMAYLHLIVESLKAMDIKLFFKYMFMPVGGNTGRELQGLIGFFYPTCNYLWHPLAMGTMNGGSYNYDSWTASLFCYTPIIILFFSSILRSARKKQFAPLIALAICCYFLFTNFAYYFFFLFTGDGYGRWYIVLVPAIIYFAVKELDEIKDAKKWEIPAGSLMAAAFTLLAFVLCVVLLKNKTLDFIKVDDYTKNEYFIPAEVEWDNVKRTLLWVVYYQTALVAVEGIVLIFMQNSKLLHHVLTAFLVVETAVMGNLSFIYGYSIPVRQYNGGDWYSESAVGLFDDLNKMDDSYFRTQSDTAFEANMPMAFGFNGASTFHSLFNYGLADLTRYNYMTNNEYYSDVYDQKVVGKSWSGYYNNKRFGFDTSMAFKYYVIENEGYYYGYEDSYWPNVPFGSEKVLENKRFRVYKNPYVEKMPLGHAVDHIYAENLDTDPENTVPNRSDFYHHYGGSSASYEILRNDEVFLNGAIFEDDEIATVLDDLNKDGNIYSIEGAPSSTLGPTGGTNLQNVPLSSRLVETVHSDGRYYGYFMKTDAEEFGPTDFLEDPAMIDKTKLQDSKMVVSIDDSYTSATEVLRDYGKVVFYPRYNWGEYMNVSEDGAYFVMDLTGAAYHGADTYMNEAPRIYFVGDRTNENGVLEKNVILSYEYRMIKHWNGGNVSSYGGTFGFYPNGRVKYLVFCFKGNTGTTKLGRFNLYMREKSAIDEVMNRYTSSDYNLENVEHVTDRFDFTTNFPTRKLVITSIGYDEGWKLVAKDKDGNTSTPNVYRANGGMVSFVAPSGEYSYTLRYETPQLRTGILISMVGFGIVVLYEGIRFVVDLKKKNKEEAVGSILVD